MKRPDRQADSAYASIRSADASNADLESIRSREIDDLSIFDLFSDVELLSDSEPEPNFAIDFSNIELIE